MNFAKKIYNRIIAVDIVKVFSLNAISTLVRMLAGMISVKVIALIIGPAGIALLGQLNNFSSILLGMANGGISSGITKYVAEFKDDTSQLKLFLSNAFRISLFCSLLIAIILILFCHQFSNLILMSDEYYYVFIVFGFTIILFTLNNLIISVLNGFKEFRLYVIVSIVGTFAGLIYSTLLIFLWKLPGALINAVTYQSVIFFISLWLCRNKLWMRRDFFVQQISKPVIRKYLGYSIMTLTSLALLPVSQMLLRGYVISELSATDAGIWEGVNRISNLYLSVITSAFSVYYLPRLSEISEPKELHKEIFRCYKVIIPILIAIGFFIFLFKHFLVWLLFTPDFYAMEKLFIWQLLGDFFKICSWLIAFIMIAKAKTLMFVTTETVFTFTYLIIAFILFKYNGIMGLTQGYLVNYILYSITMFILFKKLIILKNE